MAAHVSFHPLLPLLLLLPLLHAMLMALQRVVSSFSASFEFNATIFLDSSLPNTEPNVITRPGSGSGSRAL